MSLPKDPPLGLLMSMAMRQDHSLGCTGYYDQFTDMTGRPTHAQMVKSIVSTMRSLYEEASGNGFWNKENNEKYEEMYFDATR